MVNNNKVQVKPQDDILSLSDLWYMCISNWKWFVLSVAVALMLAFVYVVSMEPVYEQLASVMIKEDGKRGGMSSDVASAFSDMGLGMTSSNVENEAEVFKSPNVILEVVKRLNIDVNYTTDGRFHRTTLYGKTNPVLVTFKDANEDTGCSFTLDLGKNGEVSISDFVMGDEEQPDVIKGKINQPLKTIAGIVVISPNPAYVVPEKPATRIYVTRSSDYSAVSSVSGKLSVWLNSKNNTIIDIAYSDVSVDRAKDIINTLIEVYNIHWVEDKNQIASSTSAFINDRLAVIESELGNVDSDISTYKSANMVPDVHVAGAMYMEQANKTGQDMMALNNQIFMAKSIRESLSSGNDVNGYQLLPSNSGIDSQGIDSQIEEFNKMLMQRNNYVANSSTENPIVKNLDKQLVATRHAICSSLDNVITALETQIKNLQKYSNRTTSNIQANPTQAKNLLSVERQQKVKESLYLYLLQKREENELNKAFTAYNTRVVSTPHGSKVPVEPVTRNIFMIAFAVGLMLPTVVLYVKESMNTRIRNRKEVEDAVSVPFLAEIPEMSPKRHFWEKKPKHLTHPIMVKDGSRNVINEAFRILRTNLEFVTDSSKKENIFCTTSYNPGNGKTFITLNIAVSLAIKGKKVLLIDGDMRHTSLSKAFDSPGIGISGYLAGKIDDVDMIIKHDSEHGLDVIPTGAIPPNPTELLYSPRLKQLLDIVRERYDYIFIDCPPSDIVADTSIITKYADRTIFIIRAGMLERSMLPKLQEDYDTQRFPNMMLILNGTIYENNTYGNRYGYSYAYGYGYYGSNSKDYYSKE